MQIISIEVPGIILSNGLANKMIVVSNASPLEATQVACLDCISILDSTLEY